ncbi:monooxygenase [Ktedonobacter sp. SOSP1-85]|uniref:FAD-dependent oxidoreductase n=1 Tax=Ktedonobacter sp. SOSP1-85 TaxID=2778367 RepID=UPI001916864D|nr:FAD-dependent oxidoreductase [Ktedonobacter sp. SOSP1-85]GHO81078.1 monooxygenase [Ktedonobacter sp. SOSP1-85]
MLDTSVSVSQTSCCIVGGGPAGAMLGLLLARQNIPVVLLESHMDFDRDFRGDTVFPSVLDVVYELGLIEKLMKIPHTKISKLSMQTPKGVISLADYSRLRIRFPHVTILPQPNFISMLIEEAKQYPHFQVLMGAQVDGLLQENGKVCGVRYRGQSGRGEIQAQLVVGADGRFSRVRKMAGLEPQFAEPTMDILWTRLSRKPSDPELATVIQSDKGILSVSPRPDVWQLGYPIPKGSYARVHERGLEALRRSIANIEPLFEERVNEIKDWKQVSVFSIQAYCLKRWYAPGVLLIGDSAHAMSPIAGAGINLAVQDAVTASNILGDKLKAKNVQPADMEQIQRARMLPVKLIQNHQQKLQKRLVKPLEKEGTPPSLPLMMRVFFSIPFLRDIPMRVLLFGLRPVHIKA